MKNNYFIDQYFYPYISTCQKELLRIIGNNFEPKKDLKILNPKNGMEINKMQFGDDAQFTNSNNNLNNMKKKDKLKSKFKKMKSKLKSDDIRLSSTPNLSSSQTNINSPSIHINNETEIELTNILSQPPLSSGNSNSNLRISKDLRFTRKFDTQLTSFETIIVFDLHHVLMRPKYKRIAKIICKYPEKKKLIKVFFLFILFIFILFYF